MNETLDLRTVQASTFEPLIGAEFVSGDPEASFVLVDVQRFAIQPHAPRSEPFALTFVGPPGLEQRIYELQHASLGHLAMFLVPIGPGPDGRPRYEAAFN